MTRKSKPKLQRNFYPRPPRGGRLAVHGPEDLVDTISIHALREEGDIHDAAEFDGDRGISIHALREEGDRGHPERCSSRLISIHALREEGDLRIPG